MEPYPLLTLPYFRDYLWGGRKLQTVLGKALPEDGVWAESWEIVDHAEHESEVTNGPLSGQTLRDVCTRYPQWFAPASFSQGQRFPLLLKYLDCQRDLSVQVHPNDRYAQQMTPPDLGKTEAWYIIDAEPGALLYAGLKPDVSRDQLQQALDVGAVDQYLHAIQPEAGDCVFIPAGTVHALGAGLLVAEIQQASNTTFRLFDWNRVDKEGKPRPLHIEQALEVVDFLSEPRSLQPQMATSQHGRTRLVACDKFVLDRIQDVDKLLINNDGKFHLLTIPCGSAEIYWQGETGRLDSLSLEIGQSVLIPAGTQNVDLRLAKHTVLLDMYLP